MIEQIEKTLTRTSKSLRAAFEELGLDIEKCDLSLLTIDTCDNCEIWYPKDRLKPDGDGYLICGFCRANIGK